MYFFLLNNYVWLKSGSSSGKRSLARPLVYHDPEHNSLIPEEDECFGQANSGRRSRGRLGPGDGTRPSAIRRGRGGDCQLDEKKADGVHGREIAVDALPVSSGTWDAEVWK